MTFPAAWTRIRVTGKYLLADGTPAQGHVVFSSPQIVLVDDTIVLPVDYVAQLDVDGAIAIDLPATNDPDVTPSGWAWRVNECISRRKKLPPVPGVPANTSTSTSFTNA